MAKVQNVSQETKQAIQRKSAYSLPNNPSDSGYKANDIRNAFYKPIIDAANSALTEIDRVVNEVNAVLGLSSTGIDSIDSVVGGYYNGTDGLVYSFDSNSFTVIGYDGDSGEVTIPSTVSYNGSYYTVVAIAENACRGNTTLTYIEIPSTIESIGDYAFYGCTNLKKIKFLGSTILGTAVFNAGSAEIEVPKDYESAYKTSLASYVTKLVGFDTVTHNATDIATLFSSKVNKITDSAQTQRVYTISKLGGQTERKLVETPTEGEIPLYVTGGNIAVGTPTSGNNATPKDYVENRLKSMGAYINFTIDPSTYIMTLQLKNESGDVLSTGTIDLPLESMIIGASYADGILTFKINTTGGNSTIAVSISDLISGLVSDTTFNTQVQRIDSRLNSADTNIDALADEIALKEIYAHAAYHAEEADIARNFTKGGKIDKRFHKIESLGGTSLAMDMDSDYKLTVSLYNSEGEKVSSDMVDLPIESLITKAKYSNGKLILTFQSGDTANVDISSLISGLVEDSRTINSKPLSADVTLAASDVGAYSKTETTNLIGDAKQELYTALEEKEAVGYAYNSAEAEKANGYIKGGTIDKMFTALNERIKSLENK
jgi:hypothetical protein